MLNIQLFQAERPDLLIHCTIFAEVKSHSRPGINSEQTMGLPSWNLCFCGFKIEVLGFPGGAVVESLPANEGDTGSRPGLGRSHVPRSN